MNSSPWLAQLNQSRIITELSEDLKTDIAVVGGGIAGMTTAYFILKMTTKKVALVEAFQIAHGATGHNAGQIISYFEKPYLEIVKEYGRKLAVKAKDSIDQAWGLLDEIVAETKMTAPVYKFTGHAGFAQLEEILKVLKESKLNEREGLPKETLLIAGDAPFLKEIPTKYQKYYSLTNSEYIQEVLETKGKKFWAVGGIMGGCMNSALFVEELAGYLLKTYPERFRLYEHAPVNKVVLTKNSANLMIGSNLLVAQRVVLCTNGFENISIVNLDGPNIDVKYHDQVEGMVGYMAGYKENSDKPPGASFYFEGNKLTVPYFYLTRRPFTLANDKYNLVCIGGPETPIPDNGKYNKEHVFPLEAKDKIDQFIRTTMGRNVKEDIDYKFFWHGLMGYTKSGLRMVGPDPLNPVLLYNLGCNGVGILPSIFGGKRVAQFILRRRLGPSVFDPFNMSKL